MANLPPLFFNGTMLDNSKSHKHLDVTFNSNGISIFMCIICMNMPFYVLIYTCTYVSLIYRRIY